MKANELRIGNLILDSDNDICVIQGFTTLDNELRVDSKIGCDIIVDYPNDTIYNHCSINSNDIKPIPLTEEFYRKIQNKLFEAGLEYSHSSITNRLFIYIGNRTIICDFIHNIQNLYFSLTNEELKII